MENNPIQNIALVLNSEYRYFLVDFARALRDQTGSKIYLYCRNSDKARYMRSVAPKGVFDSIIDADILNKAIKEDALNEDEVFAKAIIIESELRTTLNWFAIRDRHLCRGAAATGFFHPRSRQSEETSYVQMVHGLTLEAEFWLNEIRTKAINLVINGPPIVNAAARALKIPYRFMYSSKTEDFHYWATASTSENPNVQRAFNMLTDVPTLAKDMKPYASHLIIRDKQIKGVGFTSFMRRTAVAITNQLIWKLRGDQRAQEYYLLSRLGHILRKWKASRLLGQGPGLADLDGLRYVFFPLQTDPESSLQGLSPEFFFQHSAIIALSRDLPAGVKLVIKDCMEVLGRRSPHFHDQLRDLKNVILVDTLEFGIEIVKKSAAVASISSTAAFEAAVMGKPVISFGRHNVFGFLPHVYNVKDIGNLKPEIASALSRKFDHKKALNDGAKFLQAVVDTSFRMREYDSDPLKGSNPQSVEDAMSFLIESLELNEPPLPAGMENGPSGGG
jgi:hypothetical protein